MPNLNFDELMLLRKIYESHGVQENEIPTAQQLANVLADVNDRQRLFLAERFVENGERAMKCLIESHAGALKFAREHVCESTESAYQRGADDFAKALQEGLNQS